MADFTAVTNESAAAAQPVNTNNTTQSTAEENRWDFAAAGFPYR
jgi:hypothetical protein